MSSHRSSGRGLFVARRSVVPWLLAVALVPIAPARGENRAIPLEPALVQSLREIEAAFRAGDAGRLEDGC